MPRAFLIKKKQSTLLGASRPHSPKLYSPSSSGIASPTSSTASSSSSSPRNDENEHLVRFQTSSPKYTFDRQDNAQCLDLSMKSLLKEPNTLTEKSIKMEYSPGAFISSLYTEPASFPSSYSYPGKFAKIAGFHRTGEVGKSAFVAANASPRLPTMHQTSSPVAPVYKSGALNYSAALESASHRLAPYSINWSEHFSVNKLISPTPSSHGSDDSGRGSEQSEESLNESAVKMTPPAGGVGGGSNKKSDRYQCADCSKSYSTQSGLAKHQEFHCSSQVTKSFSCKHCEKVYVSLGALKMHIRTHTLPCKCKLCGKAFSRPWLLQGHIRTHTGEKPFSCNYCSRSFADRSNLRAHLQTHSVVKKYNCKTCSRTFSRMSLLLKHEDNGCNASAARMSACSPGLAASPCSVQH